MEEEKSALIAMSGGVDSSVAAHLMLAEGFRCRGVTMRLLPEDDGQNCADAESVCERLGIPFSALDLIGDFEEAVIRPFIQVYQSGGTPNPCVDCNRCLKFSPPGMKQMSWLSRRLALTKPSRSASARTSCLHRPPRGNWTCSSCRWVRV